jgi:hypothetical protein
VSHIAYEVDLHQRQVDHMPFLGISLVSWFTLLFTLLPCCPAALLLCCSAALLLVGTHGAAVTDVYVPMTTMIATHSERESNRATNRSALRELILTLFT